MDISYSKLLVRYQSRNGDWFAVNRKHKVKQKRVKRSSRGNGLLGLNQSYMFAELKGNKRPFFLDR